MHNNDIAHDSMQMNARPPVISTKQEECIREAIQKSKFILFILTYFNFKTRFAFTNTGTDKEDQ